MTDENSELFEQPVGLPKMPSSAYEILKAVLRHRGWDEREGQVGMTAGISDAFRNGYPGEDIDISVNAPVGTGKSLSYIIAAIASGKRVVVATSTKSLQDQLINEELPKLKEDLKAIYDYELTFGMMKGKSNYPCISSTRAMLNSGDNEDLTLFEDIEQPDVRDVDILRQILERAEQAQATQDVVSFDAEALMGMLQRGTRAQISGSKSCAIQREKWVDPAKLGIDTSEGVNPAELAPEVLDEFREAPEKIACQSKCIYRAAYAHAMSSQVVVINTTLLAYELIKTDSIVAEGSLSPYLLKGIGMVVVDEAHHLFRILAEAFSVEFNVHKAMAMVDDMSKKLSKRYGETPMFDRFRNDFIDFETKLNYAIDGDSPTENGFRKEISTILFDVAERSTKFVEDLLSYAARAERAEPSGLALDRNGVPKLVAGMGAQVSEDVIGVAVKLADQMGNVDSQGRHQFSLNFADAGQSLYIKTVPIDVSFFRKMVSRASSMFNVYTGDTGLLLPATVVLSSGTISKQTPVTVGMKLKNYLDVPSPFDPTRARLYVPNSLGRAQGRDDKEWVGRAWKEIEGSILKLGGRTLILTTSHLKCGEFTDIARAKLPKDYKVVSQSDNLGKAQLIREFKDGEKMVLVGTTSFWEGVDIPGDDLNLVVVEKLPFPQPNDPIFKARAEFVEARGGNAFMEVNVDYAAIMLAQGLGRLIRATGDIGGAIILDERVRTTRYAQNVVGLLPSEWKVTSSKTAFEDWIQEITPLRRKPNHKPSTPDPIYWENIRQVRSSNGLKRRKIAPGSSS